MKRQITAGLLLSAALGMAQENYTTNWTGHRTLGLNTGASGAAVNTNVLKFPVLIRLGAADSALFAASKLSGADIRFTKNDNATRLKHEIEKWDSAGRSASIWVSLDTVKASTVTLLRMHWGNAAAMDSSSGAAVFDTANKFQAVWHMKSAAGNESDATGNNFTLSAGTGNTGANTPSAVSSGAIGAARGFDGSQKYFVALNTASSVLNFPEGGPFTLSAWVTRTSGNTSNRVILNKSDAAYGLQQSASQRSEGCDVIGTTNVSWQCVNGPVLPNDSWQHVVYVRSASGATLGSGAMYINGVLVSDTVVAPAPSGTTGRVSAANVHVGADKNGAYPGDETGNTSSRRRWWNGNIDEVRMSNGVRSADWIKLEYANQKAGQNFVTSVDSIRNVYYVMPGTGNAPRDTMVFMTGVAVNIPLKYTGGPVDSVLVTAGALPAGLTINKFTGVLSGTATALAAASSQTVTVYSSSGNATRGLRVSVIAGPTLNLRYSQDTATYPVGIEVSNGPTWMGRAPTAFTVTPALPAGLTLNATTGVISGTPTAATAAANYAVKGMNATDTATATLRIEISASEDFATWAMHKDWWTNTQNNGARVHKAVRNFPVLVRLDSVNFGTGFAQSIGRGADIRFTKSDNATRLPHQIERWDSAGRKAEIWVLIDSIPGNAFKLFRMHWSKAGAVSTSNGAAVFKTTNGFQAVWHMNGATDASNELDATSNNLTAFQTSAPPVAAGPVAGARNFDNAGGTNDYFTVTGSASVLTNAVGSSFTISAWTNLGAQNAHATLVSKHDNAYALKLDNATNWEIFEYNAGWNSYGGTAEAGVWKHVMGVIHGTDPAQNAMYIDGVRTDAGPITTSSTAARNDAIDLLIGAEPQSATTRRRPYVGLADEIRIAGVARDTAWAMLEFQNQKPGQTLVTFTQPVNIHNAAARLAAYGFSAKPLGEGLLFRINAGSSVRVRVALSDMSGRPVWSRAVRAADAGALTWDGRNATGARVAPGVYSLRITFLDASNKAVQVLDRRLPYTR